MECSEIREILGHYLDDELSWDERRRVEEHLAACQECAREFESLGAVASWIASPSAPSVPESLWAGIERQLDKDALRSAAPKTGRWALSVRRAPLAIAAALLIALGLGVFGLEWSASRAEASTVDFGVLLDALPLDAEKAFRKFLVLYEAAESSPLEVKRSAPALDFEVPDVLPGGFQLEAVFLLRFGDHPGVAAKYDRDGEFLGTIFHAPIQRENFGTHKDYACVVGQHRGHKVEVGEWKLVHLTDPTTCHCVLSKLDETQELPGVMAAVAPGSLQVEK